MPRTRVLSGFVDLKGLAESASLFLRGFCSACRFGIHDFGSGICVTTAEGVASDFHIAYPRGAMALCRQQTDRFSPVRRRRTFLIFPHHREMFCCRTVTVIFVLRFEVVVRRYTGHDAMLNGL